MAAAAHDPEFAKEVGVPVSVARDFNAADRGRKLAELEVVYRKKPIRPGKQRRPGV
jgi:hypothetical protein